MSIGQNLIFILSLATFTGVLHADEFDNEKLKNAYKTFSSGDYVQTLSELEHIKKSDAKTLAAKYYLSALAHNRLQQFDLSIPDFELAQKYGPDPKDLSYELGQAQYANNDLEKAQKSFLNSITKDYKSDTSLYYVAHIFQILENHAEAKKNFLVLANKKSAEKSLRQVARFQMAESLLSMARKTNDAKRKVKRYILPQMLLAQKMVAESSVARDIEQRMKEVEKEFGLDPNTMVNGRKISAKKLGLSFSHNTEYDNNVTLSNDLPGSQASQKDSYVFDSAFDVNYKFIINQKYIIKPQLGLDHKIHEDRDSQTVYSNDSYNISPALDLRVEHTLFSQPATILFDYDYDYKARARDATLGKTKIFNSRTQTYSLGEKIRLIGKGDSNIKIKRKIFRSYDRNLHTNTNILSIDHVIPYSSTGHLQLFLFQYDDVDNFESTDDSTSQFLLRTDYIIPKLALGFGMNLAFSYTSLSYDGAAKKTARGTEVTISPSMELNRKVNDYLNYAFSYSYTNNKSKLVSNKYTKHVSGLKVSINF